MPNWFTYRADDFELGFVVGKEEALTFSFTLYQVQGSLSTHDEKIFGQLSEDGVIVKLTHTTIDDVPPSVLTG